VYEQLHAGHTLGGSLLPAPTCPICGDWLAAKTTFAVSADGTLVFCLSGPAAAACACDCICATHLVHPIVYEILTRQARRDTVRLALEAIEINRRHAAHLLQRSLRLPTVRTKIAGSREHGARSPAIRHSSFVIRHFLNLCSRVIAYATTGHWPLATDHQRT